MILFRHAIPHPVHDSHAYWYCWLSLQSQNIDTCWLQIPIALHEPLPEPEPEPQPEPEPEPEFKPEPYPYPHPFSCYAVHFIVRS